MLLRLKDHSKAAQLLGARFGVKPDQVNLYPVMKEIVEQDLLFCENNIMTDDYCCEARLFVGKQRAGIALFRYMVLFQDKQRVLKKGYALIGDVDIVATIETNKNVF